MPAQKYKPRTKKRGKIKTKKKYNFKFLFILLLVLFSIALVLSLNKSTKNWNGTNILSLVTPGKSGDVNIIVFDPTADEVSKIIIPGNTQIKVARQFGFWKIKSLWQLGLDEKIGGELLAESVTNHMKLPVVAWADSYAEGFSQKGLGKLLSAVLLTQETNLTIGDKLRLAIFVLGVQNTDFSIIDLKKSTYLRKVILADGEDGYVTTGIPPQNIALVFSHENQSKDGIMVRIVDRTKNSNLAEEMGKTIQVAGGKITSIVNENYDNTDCVVYGDDKFTVEYISQLFDCENNIKKINNFDLEIVIGEKFVQRY